MMRVIPVLLLLLGCADEPLGLASECSRTSQCDQPLVCRLEACRNECASARDCPVGSVCLLDETGFGACRLREESSCDDCPATLSCIDGQCTNACSTDTDCAPGNACEAGGCAPADLPCLTDVDCPGGVCTEGTCTLECLSDRDCRFGGRCLDGTCTETDASVPTDTPTPIDSMTPDSGGREFVPVTGASAVAAGFGFTCAILEGDVHCWGGLPPFGMAPFTRNERGVCPPFEGATAQDVVTSSHHFCALVDGSLRCGGDNRFGECGDGTTDEPVGLVDAMLSPVTAVSAGGDMSGAGHTCGISGGEVYCWGFNFTGLLGDGTMTASLTPVATGFTNAVAVAAGTDATCATNAAGELWCWGGSAPAPAAGALVPTQVPTLGPVVSVSLSNGTLGPGTVGCIVTMDGRPYCWTPGGSLTPVVTADSFIDVSAGSGHYCFVRMDRTVTCFGVNRAGQLGIGMGLDSAPLGTSVVTDAGVLTSVVDISAGWEHTCAVTDVGDVYCWGSNEYGQLGHSGRASSTFARRVTCAR